MKPNESAVVGGKNLKQTYNIDIGQYANDRIR